MGNPFSNSTTQQGTGTSGGSSDMLKLFTSLAKLQQPQAPPQAPAQPQHPVGGAMNFQNWTS